MKQILILFIGMMFITNVMAQTPCPETVACKANVTVSAGDQDWISIYDFLENGSEFEQCDDFSFLVVALVDESGKEISSNVKRVNISCPLESGTYDYVLTKRDDVHGGGVGTVATCHGEIEIKDLNLSCDEFYGDEDITIIFDCVGDEVVGMSGQSRGVNKNEEFCVPFAASNFEDIISVGSGLSWDPEVLHYQSFHADRFDDVALNNALTDDGQLRFILTSPNLTKYSFEDGEEVFRICFDAIGEENEYSKVSLIGIGLLQTEIVQLKDDIIVAPHCVAPAVINIGSQPAFNRDYKVSLNGQELDGYQSDVLNGSALLQDGDNVLTFETEGFENYLEDISTLDLVIGLKMFVLSEPIDPLAAIALDVDQSGGINVADLVMMRQLILGQRIDLPHPGHFFVKTEYNFGADFDVFNYGLFNSYTFSSDEYNGGELIFSAHKYGNLSEHNFRTQETEVRSITEKLSFENKYIVAGQPTTVKFNINSQKDFGINAFQTSLKLDQAFVTDVNHNYAGSKFLSYKPEAGLVNLLYASSESIEELSFQLIIESEASGFVADILSLNDEFKVELVKDDLSTSKIELDAQAVESKEFKIVPNPFNTTTTVSIPQEYLGGNLIITNVLGRRIHNSLITNEEISVDRSMLKSSGVYLVTLETQNRTITRRLIFQE